MTAMERITKLFNDAADMMIVSLFLIVLVVIYLPGIQNRWTYSAAAFAFGVTLPLAARAAGLPGGIDIIACILGVICGPLTAARMQGKTVFEVVEEIRRARAGRDGGQGDA